jgi:general secretion pathway protein I
LARGFTLLEVLVALVIVGFGLTAVFNQLSQSLLTAQIIRERTLAHWVAMDRIAELRLSGVLPDVGERTDQIEMAGIEWEYVIEFSNVGVDNFRRVDVRVSYADKPDQLVTELAGFMGAPPDNPGQAPAWAPIDPFGGSEN